MLSASAMQCTQCSTRRGVVTQLRHDRGCVLSVIPSRLTLAFHSCLFTPISNRLGCNIWSLGAELTVGIQTGMVGSGELCRDIECVGRCIFTHGLAGSRGRFAFKIFRLSHDSVGHANQSALRSLHPLLSRILNDLLLTDGSSSYSTHRCLRITQRAWKESNEESGIRV
jgi:hypothetical protein